MGNKATEPGVKAARAKRDATKDGTARREVEATKTGV